MPSSSMRSATAPASACGVGFTPSGSGGDWPKPGRSTAITSRRSASGSEHGLPHAQLGADPVEEHDRLALAAALEVEVGCLCGHWE